MPYFYDARDDIIELICAELFAVASISNYPSFLKESLTAYSNYKKPNFLENKGIYEQYEKKYLNKDAIEAASMCSLFDNISVNKGKTIDPKFVTIRPKKRTYISLLRPEYCLNTFIFIFQCYGMLQND